MGQMRRMGQTRRTGLCDVGVHGKKKRILKFYLHQPSLGFTRLHWASESDVIFWSDSVGFWFDFHLEGLIQVYLSSNPVRTVFRKAVLKHAHSRRYRDCCKSITLAKGMEQRRFIAAFNASRPAIYVKERRVRHDAVATRPEHFSRGAAKTIVSHYRNRTS